MKYVNAKTILPASLVRELQQYIQGGYIYVPAGDDRKKRWGEISGYRQELQHRNREITEKYRSGVSVAFLAEKIQSVFICCPKDYISEIKKGPASVCVHIQTALGQDLPFFIQNDSAPSGG